ncbi:MAG: glycosyltransferase family 4 protein [Anaerolineae bacterium]
MMTALPASAYSSDLHGLVVCMVGPHHPRPGGVTVQVETLSRNLRNEGIDVRRVDTNVQAFRSSVYSRRLLPFVQLLVVPWRLQRASRGADLIHVHLASYWGFYLPMLAIAWAHRWRKTPVVASYHGGAAQTFFQRQARLIKPFLRHITALITSSQAIGNTLSRAGLKPVILPNVIDLDQVTPGSARLRPVSATPAPRLLWIKRFDHTGDPETMVRAFARVHAQMPAVHLTMIGEGERLTAMQALARELGIPIDFAGRVSVDQIRAAYVAADLFVSSSAVDNQPNTLIEASASGLPIVATAVGGVPEMVHDEVDALLTPPGDAGALAAAILRLLREAGLAERLGQAALTNAERFTWPAVQPQIFEVYKETNRQTGK